MKVNQLKKNVNNPRKISTSQKVSLQKSLRKFGDLGCIIENIKSGNLVSGHQRVSQLDQDATIKIITKYDSPTSTGTIAEGYIESNGEQYKFRRVDWDLKTETEALLSANKSGGEWDNDILRLNFADFPDLDIEAMGFEEEELADLGIELQLPDIFANQFDDDETDAQYLKKNKGDDTFMNKERIPNHMLKTLINQDTTPSPITDIPIDQTEDPFDTAGQKTDIVGKRHVIIIDCEDSDVKKELKKKLKPLVEEAKANFF